MKAVPPSANGEPSDALLLQAWPIVEPAIERYLANFFENAAPESVPHVIFQRLGYQEIAQLRAAYESQVRLLFMPGVSHAQLMEGRKQFGRFHGLSGVQLDWYFAAIRRLHGELVSAICSWGTEEERAAFGIDINNRLVCEMEDVVGAVRSVDAERSIILSTLILTVNSAETLADLIRNVLEVLTGLDGLDVAYFGRPDTSGRFIFETAAGSNLDRFSDSDQVISPPVTIDNSEIRGQGPAGRAWRRGTIERSDLYQKDPTTAPWHELGRLNNWEASVAVPLMDVKQEPRALLSLYSSYPGYFGSSGCTEFLSQLQLLLGPALSSLEKRRDRSGGVVHHSQRLRHLEKLTNRDVVMLYQPVVNLSSGSLMGFEALARLSDKDKLIEPLQFLPSFGDAELFSLFEIGLYQVLAILAQWDENGLNTSVSINLPPRGLDDDRYVGVIEAALESSGIAPERLTLELLETEELDLERALKRLYILKNLGIGLAEDDLGAGYSSLSRMKAFQFDVVKIDQGFVRGMEEASFEALAFIETLLRLAHHLGVSVVVEGLETVGLIEAAAYLGAEGGQGYGIAKPLVGVSAPDWVRSFKLGLSGDLPRTGLGGLAGHLAWESHRARPGIWSSYTSVGSCPLGFLIERTGPFSRELQHTHQRLHAYESSGDRRAYSEAWELLHRQLRNAGL